MQGAGWASCRCALACPGRWRLHGRRLSIGARSVAPARSGFASVSGGRGLHHRDGSGDVPSPGRDGQVVAALGQLDPASKRGAGAERRRRAARRQAPGRALRPAGQDRAARWSGGAARRRLAAQEHATAATSVAPGALARHCAAATARPRRSGPPRSAVPPSDPFHNGRLRPCGRWRGARGERAASTRRPTFSRSRPRGTAGAAPAPAQSSSSGGRWRSDEERRDAVIAGTNAPYKIVGSPVRRSCEEGRLGRAARAARARRTGSEARCRHRRRRTDNCAAARCARR